MRAAPKDHAFLLIMAARILRMASFLFGERWNSVPLYCYKGLPFFFFFKEKPKNGKHFSEEDH